MIIYHENQYRKTHLWLMEPFFSNLRNNFSNKKDNFLSRINFQKGSHTFGFKSRMSTHLFKKIFLGRILQLCANMFYFERIARRLINTKPSYNFSVRLISEAITLDSCLIFFQQNFSKQLYMFIVLRRGKIDTSSILCELFYLNFGKNNRNYSAGIPAVTYSTKVVWNINVIEKMFFHLPWKKYLKKVRTFFSKDLLFFLVSELGVWPLNSKPLTLRLLTPNP